MASEKTTAEITFIKDQEYRVYPATGAWGGVSPNGDVYVDFYIERRQTPDKLFLDFEGTKQVGERREPDPQNFTRECLAGLVLKPSTARSIGEFLLSLADKVQKSEENSE